MVLKLHSALESPGGLVKTLAAQPHFQFWTLEIWGEAGEFAFLSSLLRTWETHFENHCSKVSVLDPLTFLPGSACHGPSPGC